MDASEFVGRLAGIVEAPPEKVSADFHLADGVWDSVAWASTVALIDEYADVYVSAQELAGCATIADVLALARRQEA